MTPARLGRGLSTLAGLAVDVRVSFLVVGFHRITVVTGPFCQTYESCPSEKWGREPIRNIEAPPLHRASVILAPFLKSVYPVALDVRIGYYLSV